jgi:Helix-turn-helix domain
MDRSNVEGYQCPGSQTDAGGMKRWLEQSRGEAQELLDLADAALERLLNIDEAARIIGRAHWTLRRNIRCGNLRCVRIGRRIMIEPSEIRRVIEEGRQ